MKHVGLIVIALLTILVIAVVSSACSEGFVNPLSSSSYSGKPNVEVVSSRPSKPSPIDKVPADGLEQPLPSAPIDALSSVNPIPFQDPSLKKTDMAALNHLKGDMDSFATFEMPNLANRSDPAVQMPIMKFQGDYQRVKDEMLVINSNPGLQPQLTHQDLLSMGANLRFLQRTYRTYADSKLVPPPKSAAISNFGEEGFTSDSSVPITVDQLSNLSSSLTVEVARLQASGTSDPILNARANLFKNMLQQVNDIITKINKKQMAPADIPIRQSDYLTFLPALGDSSAGIGKLLTTTGNSTLSSLFNAYDIGDASGADIAEALLLLYGERILKNLSYNMTVSYTSDNEVAKMNAIASAANANKALAESSAVGGLLNGYDEDGISGYSHESFNGGGLSRGEFERKTNPKKQPGHLDWKARYMAIKKNIVAAGLNPGDYGCIGEGVHVSENFSWRGHTKMVCSRLATNADPAIPEQMGCPPVSWRGWKA